MDIHCNTFVVTWEGASLVFVGEDAKLESLKLAVRQEGSEPSRDTMVRQEPNVVGVKLKRQRELGLDLVDGVQKLEENRCKTRRMMTMQDMTTLQKPVTERKPLLLNERAKPFNGPVVRIKAQLR